ncbi:hypothetical protein [Arthrobacter glacialis]|nr:hypothetical protein [Arthrobacter glacialis]
MRMQSSGNPATGLSAWAAAGIVVAALALAGCGVSLGIPEKTSAPAPSPSASSPTGVTPSAGSSESATGSQAAASQSSPASASSADWKNFTDPGKTVSFEVPQDWSVQVLPSPGAGALHLEVKDPAGTLMATLNTHITGLGGACQPASSRPYTVLASLPMVIPSDNTAPAAVEPRYVYRVIQGATHFFASYGLTDQSAGPDGKACLVYNTVTSKKLGVYMFGDVLQFTSAPDGSPGLRAFATIADAQAHMRSAEYQNIQKMVTSLKVLG